MMKNLLYFVERISNFYLRKRFAILKENRVLKELYCYAIQFELVAIKPFLNYLI
jgi:hypothetical protein